MTGGRELTLAVAQMRCGADAADNLDRAEALVRHAAVEGAGLVLLQELFETPYFCQDQEGDNLRLARPATGHPTLRRFAALAAELGVVLPISFFERANMARYNSGAVIDADGRILGTYRKSHIPDGPGYREKFHFNPGDTGFRAWDTAVGRIGVAICWDQWFPEAARAMALQGAELLLYPTAIGSEPRDPSLDSRDHWRRVMQGHAAANMVPVAAANRIGIERGDESEITFYGQSFIADETGAVVRDLGDGVDQVALHRLDLGRIAEARDAWGLFRDRRPELYRMLMTSDGEAS